MSRAPPRGALSNTGLKAILESCKNNRDLVLFYAQNPPQIRSLVGQLREFEHDPENRHYCIELLTLFLQSSIGGFDDLKKDENVARIFHSYLLKNDLSNSTMQHLVIGLYNLADHDPNVEYLLDHHFLRVLFEIGRGFMTKNNVIMTKFVLKFIKKVAQHQSRRTIGCDILNDGRGDIDCSVLIQIVNWSEQTDITELALTIMALARRVHHSVVKRVLCRIEIVLQSEEVPRKLAVSATDLLTSILTYPFSNHTVTRVIQFIDTSMYLLRVFKLEGFNSDLECLNSLMHCMQQVFTKNARLCHPRRYMAIIRHVFQKHCLVSELQLLAVRSIVIMAHSYPSPRKIFMREDVETFVPALEIHRPNVHIVTAVCEAIYVFGFYGGPRFQTLFMEKNVETLLLSVAEEYKADSVVLRSVFRAVRGVCFQAPENAEVFSRFKRMPRWTKLFMKHATALRTVEEAILCLTCMTRSSTVMEVCAKLRMHVFMIRHVSPCNEKVVQAVLECLCAFLQIEQAANDVIKNLPQLVSLLLQKLKSESIQVEGLRLFNNICNEVSHFSLDDSLSECLFELLLSEFREHFENPAIKKELFLGLKVFCEKSRLFCAKVVKTDICDFVFRALEDGTFSDDVDLQFILRDFFLALQINDSGSTLDDMLLRTAEKDFMAGMVCLVSLSANVNYSVGGYTCLKKAVINQNREMVRFILENGAKDVRDCLKLGLDIGVKSGIMSLLFRYIGGNSESSTVSWEKLGLTHLVPEWLMDTFAAPDHRAGSGRRCGKHRSGSTLAKLILANPDEERSRKVTPAQSVQLVVSMYDHQQISEYYHALTDDLVDETDVDSCPPTPSPSRVPSSNSQRRKKQTVFGGPADGLIWDRQTVERSPSRVACAVSPLVSQESRQRPDKSEHFFSENTLDVPNHAPPEEPSEYSDDSDSEERPRMPESRSSVASEVTPVTPSFPTPETFFENIIDCDERPRTDSLDEASTSYSISSDMVDSADLANLKDLSEKDMPSSSTVARLDKSPSTESSLTVKRFESPLGDTSKPESLPRPFARSFFQVEEFSLSYNQISSLREVSRARKLLHYFAYLKVLCLDNNKLDHFPYHLAINLCGLERLFLSDNKFVSFPKEVLYCGRLKSLDLSFNGIDCSAAAAGDFLVDMTKSDAHFSDAPILESLTVLKLHNNEIESWPMWLCKHFPNLDELYLGNNLLTGLPNRPCGLTKLSVLDVSGNQLTEIGPDFLTSCNELRQLVVHHNELKKLPKACAANMLPSLWKVDAKCNKLGSPEPPFIPEFILNLAWLRDVNLSDNGIVRLPPSREWHSKCLSKLRLSNNRITSLDLTGDTTAFEQITELYLDCNELTSLPDEISELARLEVLDISNNRKVRKVPSNIYKCDKLMQLQRQNVPLDVPNYIKHSNTKDLLKFLKDRNKRSSPYYTAKMLILGFGNRGKTTLLKNLKRTDSAKEYPSIMTLGIEISEWNFKAYDRNVNQKVTFNLNCWDFAGQDDFYATHQVFLSQNALFLVVFDLSAPNIDLELNQVSGWLFNIHAKSPRAPIIIVGTNSDKIPANLLEDRKEYAVSFLQRSAFMQYHRHDFAFCGIYPNDNSPINRLRDLIRTRLENFKVDNEYFMGRRIPFIYQQVEAVITKYKSQMKTETSWTPIVSLNDLYKVVKAANLIISQSDLKLALRFLNNIGSILNFEGISSELSDLYFLDAQWLCVMMSKLVTLRTKHEGVIVKGVVTSAGLTNIYSGLSEKLLTVYLRILEKFCIVVPLSADSWLVPCRLEPKPGINPISVHRKPGDRWMTRVYALQVLPQSLIPIFLTRVLQVKNKLLRPFDPPVSFLYYADYLELCWDLDDPFAIVQVLKKDNIRIMIQAPVGFRGRQVLGSLVDQLDSVIEEWFDGISPQTPAEDPEESSLRRFALCTRCPRDREKQFDLNAIAEAAAQKSTVFCDATREEVPIEEVAPDVILADIEQSLHLNLTDLQGNLDQKNMLGDGAFGSVFRCKLNGNYVAVKLFKSGQDGSSCESYMQSVAFLRQELKVMMQLQHPSILATLGVVIRPHRLLILELAPFGSLKGALRANSVASRYLKWKIALQIAEGLEVLHAHDIVYRDLKPDNILIFSLSLDATINAKIADYGIARNVTSFTKLERADMGTVGYKSPEQIAGDYSYKSDVYAFGVVLYVIVTNGIHPFEELTFSSMIDDAVLSGASFPSVSERNAAPWPDMESLIAVCVQRRERHRPDSRTVARLLRKPSFLAIRRKDPVLGLPRDSCMLCACAIRVDDECIKLFVGCGNGKYGQASLMIAEYKKLRTDGITVVQLPDNDMICLRALDGELMLGGSLCGNLYLFHVHDQSRYRRVMEFGTAVLSVYVADLHHYGRTVLVGLASGVLAVISQTELLTRERAELSYADFKLLNIDSKKPILNISLRNSVLWVSSGSRILLIDVFSMLHSNYDTEKSFIISASPEGSETVNKLIVTDKNIFVSRLRSSVIEVWSWDGGKLTLGEYSRIDCADAAVGCEHYDRHSDHTVREMCMYQNSMLWVGLKNGVLLVINTHQWQHPESFGRAREYQSELRLLIHTQPDDSPGGGRDRTNPDQLVFSAGIGSFPLYGEDKKRSGSAGENEWNILSWRSDFMKIVRDSEMDMKTRDSLKSL